MSLGKEPRKRAQASIRDLKIDSWLRVAPLLYPPVLEDFITVEPTPRLSRIPTQQDVANVRVHTPLAPKR